MPMTKPQHWPISRNWKKSAKEQIMEVYKAINAVQAELAKVGISKDRRNTQGAGYNFRGIDDIYNALAPLLAEKGLCILPRVLARESVERVSKQGGALFYITVEAEFDFVSTVDGSKHTVKTFGEAMDSGDKATNKAMSAAYKYAAFQAFCIPTEGDNDADAQTHAVEPAKKVTPNDGAMDSLTREQKSKVYAISKAIKDAFTSDDHWKAFEEWEAVEDEDLKRGIWSQLDSKIRASIKSMKAEADKPATVE